MGGVGGGGEVFVLGRLGVAERGIGVVEPESPAVKPRKGRESSSSRSKGSLGEKEGAFGFLPGLEEDIFGCGVGRDPTMRPKC